MGMAKGDWEKGEGRVDCGEEVVLVTTLSMGTFSWSRPCIGD